MTEYALFRSVATGKVGKYPARFASRPTFERIEPEEAQCVDCWMDPEADPDELTDMETDTFGPREDVLYPEDEDEEKDN